MVMKKKHGLVGDLWPLLRLMKATGMWIFEYYDDYGGGMKFLRYFYATAMTLLLLSQYAFMAKYVILKSYYADNMAISTISLMFFSQGITKYAYFAFRSKRFYRALAFWNKINSHPLFEESSTRFRLVALKRIVKLLLMVGALTLVTVLLWTASSVPSLVWFLADNETVIEMESPDSILVKSDYFWDPGTGLAYTNTFFYQFLFLLFTLCHANLVDVMFCCLMIYTCEQLKHLKDIMTPLIRLSTVPDDDVPNVAHIFRARTSADSMHRPLLAGEDDFSNNNRYAVNEHSNGMANTIESKRRDVLMRSAIKYWVERHKHIVKFVNVIGDCFGLALLLHMLISTVMLTLLAYNATKINGLDLHGLAVIGYLLYSLGQVFLFCFYGNELMDESGSVMEAAYSCHWYEGSEPAKTFVQIVCQQCQKALVISGARFFIVSLDLFASVLGAVITYFMVLIQLK